jgi:aminoglycoside phosphotransferase (APT) family kinase protein
MTSSRSRAALAEGLASWFAARDGGAAPAITVERPQPGLSSDTLMLSVGDDAQYVARLPPLGGGLFPDYDLARQHRVQRALADSDVPVATSLAYETDTDWIGTPFLLMPKIAGHTLTTNPSYLVDGWLATAAPETQADVIDRFIGLLARIHQLDYTALDLGTLSGGGPTLAGMLAFWDRYLDWATEGGGEELVAGTTIYRDALAWCRANLPDVEPPTGLLWGDPQLTNAVLGDSGEITAVLDWEMAALGPAEVDLSWFLVLHEHAAESADTQLPGWPGRDAIISSYTDALGRDLADLHWYDVLANLRSGAIVLRIGAVMAAAGHPATWTAHVPQPRHLARLIGAV